MFKYTNLPSTIDPILLERMLQVNGVACITDVSIDGKKALYAFSGSVGGELDEYYRPTKFVIANPHLTSDGFSKEVIINGSEPHTGVLMYNDSEWQGLTALIARYASLMTENVLTVRIADIMLRKMDIIIAGTDKAKKSADVFLKQLEDGKLASMADSAFLESIRTLPVSNYNGSYLIQFIELQQYLKGSFYNELGLRANYNMKREAIGEGESTLDADSVLPLCENMLSSRRKTVELVNQLYGTDISVDYNSAWLENHIDSYLSIYNKIAESVSTMPGSNIPQEGDQGLQEGVTQGESGATVDGNSSANNNVGQPTMDEEGRSEGEEEISRDVGESRATGGESDDNSGENTKSNGSELSGAGDSDASVNGDSEQAGEDRRESESGVGRELEGTGQDEELIELEEVVEKMIDNVYDGVVNEKFKEEEVSKPIEEESEETEKRVETKELVDQQNRGKGDDE